MNTPIMMPPSPPYKRGNVVLTLFPNSDLRTAKPRPALIIQTDNLRTGLSQVIVAMITSRVSRAGHPSRFFVARLSTEGAQSGLLTDSVVMTDNLSTVIENTISRVIGSLPMQPIEVALRHTLKL